MIETIVGSDYCVFVTEPTPFGLHDLKLAVEVVRSLEIPFGVIITLYKFTFPLKYYHPFFNKRKKDSLQAITANTKFRDSFYYLLLFLIPFLFFIFTTFYAIVIYLPIVVILSVKGLVYIKNFITKLTVFSRKSEGVFLVILVFLIIGFFFLGFEFYPGIALVDILLLTLGLLALFLLVFLIISSTIMSTPQ